MLVTSSPERLTGSIVDGRYTLKKLLGAGGFGAVFRAEDRDGLPCALKLIRFERPSEQRFAFREATLMKEHAHPTLVSFQSAGRFGPTAYGFIYIAMELGDGSLYEHLRTNGPLSRHELRTLLIDLVDGLGHLHSRGVIHGDVKPGNLIRFGERYKLCDFGFARATGGAVESADPLAGTPEYMAPEAFEGEEGPPVDMWAVGLLVHECVTRRLPFSLKGEDYEGIARIVRENAPRIDARLPAELEAIVRGCLTRDPALRWTAAQVREALELARDAAPGPAEEARQEVASWRGEASQRRPRARIGVGRVLAGAALVAAVTLLSLACSEIVHRPAFIEPPFPRSR